MSEGTQKDALVSICLPVLNGAAFVERALDSALAQSYEPLEVVVSDDGSSDATVALIRDRYGPAVRLIVNSQRAGQAGNHNVAVRHCRGEFVKFLHHDDTLAPDCVAKLADALRRHRDAGLAFARRAVETAGTPEDESWSDTYGELHMGFSALEPINDGQALLMEWLTQGFPENWIGEPVAVMVRREALIRAGLFSPDLRLLIDVDLWMRILAAGFDAAFVDEKLATYRRSGESLTERTVVGSAHWLDPIWILEHLLCEDAAPARHVLEDMRRRHRRRAFRSVVRSALATPHGRYPTRPYGRYLLHRARRATLRLIRSEYASTVPRL